MNINAFDMNLIVNWFQTICVLIALLLLYNFIPNSVYILKKFHYAALVGIIFSFAAILGTFIQWSNSSNMILGLNTVLVPLAGYFGGPIAAGIITISLLFLSGTVETAPIGHNEQIILIITALIGILFYYIREKRLVKISQRWMVGILSISIALLSGSLFFVIFSPDLHTAGSLTDLHNFLILIFMTLGLGILGNIIIYIDQNKESDFELMAYRSHLEALVQERTLDLEKINALHKSTMDSTNDGIVVTDFEGTIQNCNLAATQILDINEPSQIGTPLTINGVFTTKVPDFNPGDLNKIVSGSPDYEHQMFLTFRSGNIYEVQAAPHFFNGEIIGNVLNIRDITKRKHAEDALHLVNQKLLLLSGITRHDILNQLTALYFYLNEIKEKGIDPEIFDNVKSAYQISRIIQEQIQFTSDYQDLGLNEPKWLSLNSNYQKAMSSFADQNISFSFEGQDYEIYTDPLLERVFYNLIDNSIRHGQHVSTITVRTFTKDDCLVVRYEDDGAGIEPDNKNRVFERGFGKNTGFGMFLIHEILSITGIQIKENGVFGVGVLFDIIVPIGKFRV
ncbi:ATP-binding protein [uncultured Methanospirillum sp.]|uniref:ATP-binding protein n=1 Tax=uncultured Methanospirillum sp. TaxID=262503 RepID=UPI0029C8D000|nr:ATP-binding protein [uncultured Methanospirillum sp.]